MIKESDHHETRLFVFVCAVLCQPARLRFCGTLAGWPVEARWEKPRKRKIIRELGNVLYHERPSSVAHASLQCHIITLMGFHQNITPVAWKLEIRTYGPGQCLSVSSISFSHNSTPILLSAMGSH